MKREAYNEMFLHEDNHWWFVSRRKIIQRVLNKFATKSSVNKVLEIGCGSGGNLAMLSDYGILSAVEFDDEARAAANQRNICTVIKGSLPDNVLLAEKYDLICMLDVLEHIDEDRQSIHFIETLLNPGATLLLTVPAFQFLWSAHDVANDHKRRYNRPGLQALFNDTKLDIVYSSYFNSFLFPSVYIARLINNLKGKKNEFDVKMPSDFMNKLLMTVFSTEQLFLPKISFPFGVSLMIVARKRH